MFGGFTRGFPNAKREEGFDLDTQKPSQKSFLSRYLEDYKVGPLLVINEVRTPIFMYI